MNVELQSLDRPNTTLGSGLADEQRTGAPPHPSTRQTWVNHSFSHTIEISSSTDTSTRFGPTQPQGTLVPISEQEQLPPPSSIEMIRTESGIPPTVIRSPSGVSTQSSLSSISPYPKTDHINITQPQDTIQSRLEYHIWLSEHLAQQQQDGHAPREKPPPPNFTSLYICLGIICFFIVAFICTMFYMAAFAWPCLVSLLTKTTDDDWMCFGGGVVTATFFFVLGLIPVLIWLTIFIYNTCYFCCFQERFDCCPKYTELELC